MEPRRPVLALLLFAGGCGGNIVDPPAGPGLAPAADAVRSDDSKSIPEPVPPAPAPALHQAASISAGGLHTCAVTTLGGVKCWGINDDGQLGDGTTERSLVPVDVVGLASGVVAVASADDHTCALTAIGGVKCWGANHFGELGNGSNEGSLVPTDVAGLASGVIAISAAGGTTCALTSAHRVKCWGYNGHGAVGTGDQESPTTPVEVSGLGGDIQAASAGANHSCALTTSGALKCWGNNGSGQLGNDASVPGPTQGPMVGSFVASDVEGLGARAIAIASGGGHTCALVHGGGLKCWGDNTSGALPGSGVEWTSKPVDVLSGAAPFSAIAAGFTHSCALDRSGVVTCWGEPIVGEFRDAFEKPYVPALREKAAMVSAGDYHACAVTETHTAKCWGFNYQGQLGNGQTSDSKEPVVVAGL